MMNSLTRRDVLGSLAGIACLPLIPELAQALAGMQTAADWRIAFADLDRNLTSTTLTCVQGQAPRDLSGTLYRNGPGKWHRPGKSATHWFDGDGLVRAFSLTNGKAVLSAAFVDTPKRRADEAAHAVVSGGFGTPMAEHVMVNSSDDFNAANISVVLRGDELWALWEAGSPVAIDPGTLATRGVKTLRNDLAHIPFLAHPRIDPDGTLWNLGIAGSQAIVWRLGINGDVQAAVPITLPRASYVHDFTATDKHLIILLQPWVQRAGEMHSDLTDTMEWHPQWSTQILVLDKADLTRQRVYELPAFFFFHLGSAWRDPSGSISFDVCRSADPGFALRGARDVLHGIYRPDAVPTLSLITLSPAGKASLHDTGIAAEFPRTDARRSGLSRSYTLHASIKASSEPLFTGIALHDWSTSRSQHYDFGPHHLVEEMIFVPKPGSSLEMDGWILGPTINLRAGKTELHVFDAHHVAEGPICTWQAPLALPLSLHGVFVST
jgi:all-trans-8'-apo-beta-carotenal 15,15'-oxygenase